MLNNGENPNKKRRKIQEIQSNNKQEDRLTSLPDGIIVDILSRLPFESAIATGTISRQFLNLWKQITSLKISSDLVLSTSNSKLFNAVKKLSSPKIKSFEFQFKEPLEKGDKQCVKVIRKICERKVKEIKVDFCEYDYYARVLLPDNLFVSNQLEVLELGFGFDYFTAFDCVINLPMLKKLDICVHDSDVGFLAKLVKSCVVLEELRIRGDLVKDDHCIDVFGLNLKRLCVDMVRTTQLTAVRIDAPKLELFRVCGPNLLKYCFTSKVSKTLCVEVCTDFYRVSPKACQEWEFVRSIRNAKSIVMQGDISPAFYYMNDYELPVFDRLTNLEMVLHLPVFWKALMRFLEFCPNLQTVGLARKHFPWYGSGWVELDVVPDCLSNKVKSLILRDFDGLKEELELISYILMVAKVLENLHITIAAPSSDKFKSLQLRKEAEFCEGLCRLSKSSSICQIKVNGMVLPQ